MRTAPITSGWCGFLILSALTFGVTNCTSNSGPVTIQDSGQDGALDVASVDTWEILFHDVKNDLPEVIPDVPGEDNGPEIIGPACDPGEGCFLDPCIENADCLSGWCVTHMGEGVCTQTCQDECPNGWTCKQVGGTDPDLIFVCVSDFPTLCRPCSVGDDCEGVGGAKDPCISYGAEGAFCGGACGGDGDCPWGFSCVEAETLEGVVLEQCVADSGVCPCTDTSVTLGLWTACQSENEWGICEGIRVCTDTGLSACDAGVPMEEACNGFDDDCDGDIDDGALVDDVYLSLCDDDNPCTEDSCLGEDGCQHVGLDGGECMDGNPCTVADHCEDGVCIGQAVDCDDKDPCTDDLCSETGGCEHPFNDASCDDGNPCTLADQCADGNCAGTPVPCDCQADADCVALEDGDLCNGTLVCDTAALPYKCVVDVATVLTCPEPEGDNAFCLQAACDPVNGTCATVPFHEGFLCDNGHACTVNDKCIDGECTGGVALNCNDGNPCTDNTCDPVAGCTYTPNIAACNDGDLCTLGDQCADGNCVGGPTADCEDGNACTQDTCTPEAGCQHTVTDGPCDDGDACTTNDLCVGGACQGSGVLVCTDDDPCTDNTCDPATGCVTGLNQAPCDDGDVCTVGDHCHLGECVHSSTITCNDGNVCTDDSCDPVVGCTFAANQAVCDDNNLCTEGDVCADGWCIPGFVVDCSDGNECTTDSCDPAIGCANENEEDGTLCLEENPQWVCLGGKCVCQAACVGKDCGDDGCGGSCGGCPGGTVCVTGLCEEGVLVCGDVACPALDGYDVTCNAQDHCEYANIDSSGWKTWDVWIWVPPGTFPMGAPDDEPDSDPAEGPMHDVTFAKGFLITKYEVVVAQYEACMAAAPGQCIAPSTTDWDGSGWGTNSSSNARTAHPQNGLTWQQAKDYCGWAAPGGRIPSEAEWEYAAKGPEHRTYPWGDSPLPTCANDTAVFNEAGGEGGYGCAQGGTAPAGTKANGASWCGALDMSGNLWEWCEDWWHPDYDGAPWDGTSWVDEGIYRVVRGGSFDASAFHLRTSWRPYHNPEHHFANDGARCVRPLPLDCVPDCDGKQCGDDGCGGSCGECQGPGESCEGNECVCSEPGTLAWEKETLATLETHFFDLATDTNGLIAVGTIGSENPNVIVRLLLMKFDWSGTPAWSSIVQSGQELTGNAVAVDSDGSIVVAGSEFSGGVDNYDITVRKFNSGGTQLWTKALGGSAEDRGTAIAVAANGDYLVGGWTKSIGAGASDFYVARLTSGGVITWETSFGGPGHDEAAALAATPDGGGIILGHTDSFGIGGYDWWAVRFSDDGSTVWTEAYGGTDAEYAADVVVLDTGGYALFGYTNSKGAGLWDYWLVRAGTNGAQLWDHTYGHGGWDLGSSIVAMPDGGFSMLGTRETGAFSKKWLVRTDADGVQVWDKQYDGYGSDYGWAIDSAEGGVVVMAGQSTSAEGGYSLGWVAMVDPECPQ